MVTRRDENQHHGIVPNLRGKKKRNVQFLTIELHVP